MKLVPLYFGIQTMITQKQINAMQEEADTCDDTRNARALRARVEIMKARLKKQEGFEG